MRMCVLAVVVACSVTGCAFGQKVDYRTQPITLAGYTKYDLNSSFTAVVLDERGDDELRVGTVHSLLGIPFAVNTTSGQPLAADMAESVANSLQRNGLTATASPAPRGTDVPSARRRAQPIKGDVGLLLVMKEYFSRTWFSTSLTYDLILEVINSKGAVVASSVAKGSEPVDGSSLAQLSAGVISRLFRAPEVQAAVTRISKKTPPPAAQPEPSPVVAPPQPEPERPVAPPVVAPSSPSRRPLGSTEPAAQPAIKSTPEPAAKPEEAPTRTPAKPSATPNKCSIDQILKLKELKMTDQQIKAACE